MSKERSVNIQTPMLIKKEIKPEPELDNKDSDRLSQKVRNFALRFRTYFKDAFGTFSDPQVKKGAQALMRLTANAALIYTDVKPELNWVTKAVLGAKTFNEAIDLTVVPDVTPDVTLAEAGASEIIDMIYDNVVLAKINKEVDKDVRLRTGLSRHSTNAGYRKSYEKEFNKTMAEREDEIKWSAPSYAWAASLQTLRPKLIEDPTTGKMVRKYVTVEKIEDPNTGEMIEREIEVKGANDLQEIGAMLKTLNKGQKDALKRFFNFGSPETEAFNVSVDATKVPNPEDIIKESTNPEPQSESVVV